MVSRASLPVGRRFVVSSIFVYLGILGPQGLAALQASEANAQPINHRSSESARKTTPSYLASSKTSQAAPIYTYRIINIYPHDSKAFTQGLAFVDDALYEGTGLRGKSSLRKVDLATGKIRKIHRLPPRFFGEGITVYGDKVIQLTWQARKGFIYERESFQLMGTFNYLTEGWGITHDGERLIMSDGTSILHLLDPETFKDIGRIEVRDSDGPVTRLNELEYVRGEIFANVWKTERIARISPRTGEVLGWIELKGILGPDQRTQRVDVLNGIAYDSKNDRLFVTGKLWPKIFEIELIRTSGQ